jgi:hypothetical protein
MEWPRKKGVFGKEYVDTNVLNIVTVQGLSIHLGLGAGRPSYSAIVLIDMFSKNPWTKESTSGLLKMLKEGTQVVERNPGMAAWEAMWEPYKMKPNEEWAWQELGNPTLLAVWMKLSAQSIYYGLTHENNISSILEKYNKNYEKYAVEASRYGLKVSTKPPFQSSDEFYQTCEDMFHAFESVHQLVNKIPEALRDSPEIAHRLRAK